MVKPSHLSIQRVPGTPAAERDQISEEVKTARLHELQNLIKEQQKSIQDKMVDRTVEVLFERKGRFDNQLVGKIRILTRCKCN